MTTTNDSSATSSSLQQQQPPLLLLPPPPLTPQQTLALAVAIAAARVRERVKTAAAVAGHREDEMEVEPEKDVGLSVILPPHLLPSAGPSSTATALAGGAHLRLMRLTKEEARHPLIRRLAPVVEALCLLPSLPLALWEGCLAHARTLLLQLPSQGKEEKKKDGDADFIALAVAAVVRGVLCHLLLPSSSPCTDSDGDIALLQGACAGLEALFFRPPTLVDEPQPHSSPDSRLGQLRPSLLAGLISGGTKALQALGRQLLLQPESVPLSALESLPFLLRTYERATLARLCLALSTSKEKEGATAVLSSLLDSLVAAGQALRPFRLGEAAVWRILARVKQRAVGVVAVDGGC